MANSRGGRKISQKFWQGADTGATPVVLTATQGVILQVVSSLTGAFPFTVLRVRGALSVMAIPDAAGDEGVAVLGIVVVKGDAAAAGGVSVPGPINDPDADWLWHNYVPLTNPSGAGSANNAWGSLLSAKITIDSRAMRRQSPNETIILVGETSASTWSAVEVAGGMRVLFGG